MVAAASGPTPDDARAARIQVRSVLTMTFLVFLGQFTLHPVLAPLTRSLGMREWQAGLIVSASALMVVLTSRLWGRKSQQLGRKPVLVGAALLASVSLFAFAGVAQLGMAGTIGGPLLFALLILSRGPLFGTALSAVFPTAQAFVAEVTVTESDRVRGMAGLGSVQGLAMVAGSVVGGLLAGISLVTSLAVLPFAPLAAMLVGLLFLKSERPNDLVARPVRVRATDPRVWPFLVVSLGVFTVFSMLQVTIGFIIHDRFDFASRTVPFVIGGALLAAGTGMLFAQGIVVPVTRWRPALLMRVGALTAAGGFAATITPLPIPVFLAGVFLVGMGTGLAIPGALSAPTLLVSREEQGGLAGTLSSTNGITWMATPLLATVLYGLSPVLPLIVSLALILGIAVFAMLNTRIR